MVKSKYICLIRTAIKVKILFFLKLVNFINKYDIILLHHMFAANLAVKTTIDSFDIPLTPKYGSKDESG